MRTRIRIALKGRGKGQKFRVLSAIARGENRTTKISHYTGIRKVRVSEILKEFELLGLIKGTYNLKRDARIKKYRFADELYIMTKTELIELAEEELKRELLSEEASVLLKLGQLLKEVFKWKLMHEKEFDPVDLVFDVISAYVATQKVATIKRDWPQYNVTHSVLSVLVPTFYRICGSEIESIKFPEKFVADWSKTEYYSTKYEKTEQVLTKTLLIGESQILLI